MKGWFLVRYIDLRLFFSISKRFHCLQGCQIFYAVTRKWFGNNIFSGLTFKIVKTMEIFGFVLNFNSSYQVQKLFALLLFHVRKIFSILWYLHFIFEKFEKYENLLDSPQKILGKYLHLLKKAKISPQNSQIFSWSDEKSSDPAG